MPDVIRIAGWVNDILTTLPPIDLLTGLELVVCLGGIVGYKHRPIDPIDIERDDPDDRSHRKEKGHDEHPDERRPCQGPWNHFEKALLTTLLW